MTVDPHERRREPRRSLVRWVAAGVAAIAVGVVVVLATRPTAASRAVDSPLIGRPAPEVVAQTLEGATYRLSSDRGRWVLVNFFATWCVPCRLEQPELVRFFERHQATGAATVAMVIYDDDASAVKRFQADNGGVWPVLRDPAGRLALEFGVGKVPESFLVSPDGIVVAKIVGGVRAAAVEDLMTRATGQPT